MTEKKLIEIGKWLNSQGYDLDLTDDFWMEDYLTDHKIRDIAELLDDYQRAASPLIERSNQINLLEKYTTFLQKNGYIDTDATCEEPFVIDEFLKQLNIKQC